MTTHPRSPLPWLIGGAVVVVAAFVVTLVLTTGGDDNGGQRAAGTTTAPKTSGGYDLSTPQAAAESFVAAAKTGSGDKLLGLACVGRPDCVQEHGLEPGLTEAQDTIREGVYELAVHLEKAEFAAPVDGDEPGTKEVPYRTPEMTGDAYLSLTFVKSGSDWLYYRPAES